jgi:hypothetical protein
VAAPASALVSPSAAIPAPKVDPSKLFLTVVKMKQAVAPRAAAFFFVLQ